MKKNNTKTAGFSIFEILIAMTIMIVTISAVVLVAFGNQSVLIDSQTNTEAIAKAQELLESAQAAARKDFKLVNPVPLTTVTDADRWTYTKKVEIMEPDFFMKEIKATISWQADHNRSLSISLSTLVTDFENAVGGDTCNSTLSGDWTRPLIINTTSDFAVLVGDSAGIYPITDVDAYREKLYVTTNNSSANKENFFIFSLANPASPVLASKIDNNAAANAGLNAVAVATNSAGSYAYVANGNGANFGTCVNLTGTNASCGQLQILDMGVTPPQVKYSLKIPGVTGSGGQAIGQSIFYKDGFVFLGLAKTAGGPEFNVIDVHNPLNPLWVSGYPVGNGINEITVKNGYAYLATPNSQELIVLNIKNPASPLLAGGFDAPDASGNGKSLYLVGDTLYLGRTVTPANPELYIIDDHDPKNIPALPLGIKEISSSVNGLITRDYLTFLITTSGKFQIWNTSNPSSITQGAPPLALPSGSAGAALDCEKNNFFTASNTSASKGFLTVVTSTP